MKTIVGMRSVHCAVPERDTFCKGYYYYSLSTKLQTSSKREIALQLFKLQQQSERTLLQLINASANEDLCFS